MSKKEQTHITWADLTNRDRSLISMDCEPNFTRAMIDRMSLTLSEEQIMQIEEGFRVADPDIVKDALYDHLVNCIFDDVHINRAIV